MSRLDVKTITSRSPFNILNSLNKSFLNNFENPHDSKNIDKLHPSSLVEAHSRTRNDSEKGPSTYRMREAMHEWTRIRKKEEKEERSIVPHKNEHETVNEDAG